MPAISRVESEERQKAILKFFIENPRATGDDAQRALSDGRLLGRNGPPMGLGMLFRLKRQAEELAARGVTVDSVGSTQIATAMTSEQMEAIRTKAHELQEMLAAAPGDLIEIRITRVGAHIVRAREESL